MRTVLSSALAVVLVSAVLYGISGAAPNPHIKPETCDSCHVKVPTADEGERGEYFLLKATIDATCNACHEGVKMPGQVHFSDHPSGIDKWDWKKFRRPKTLPLQNGFITCITCHFHSVPDGPAYKMVRIVKIDGKKVDWSELCRDCHVGY